MFKTSVGQEERLSEWSVTGYVIPGRLNPRKMFIHGARAAVLRVKREGSSLGKSMSGLETRTARNVVIVATANKLARISWTVLATRNDYQPCTRPPCFPTRRSDILNSFLGSLRFPSMRDLKTIDSYSEECLYSDCRPPTKLPLARAPRVKTYRPRSEL
jgi:hypothetical protein